VLSLKELVREAGPVEKKEALRFSLMISVIRGGNHVLPLICPCFMKSSLSASRSAWAVSCVAMMMVDLPSLFSFWII
jgi:hypothetical protein